MTHHHLVKLLRALPGQEIKETVCPPITLIVDTALPRVLHDFETDV